MDWSEYYCAHGNRHGDRCSGCTDGRAQYASWGQKYQAELAAKPADSRGPGYDANGSPVEDAWS
jgi:hypothetical protein